MKHFFAFKLKKDYSEKELKYYYKVNPNTFPVFRAKDELDYVGVEFSEKDDEGVIDYRNSSRLTELMANNWIICETADKASSFMNEDIEITSYNPTTLELAP